MNTLDELADRLRTSPEVLVGLAGDVAPHYYEKRIPKTNGDGSPRLQAGRPVYRRIDASTGELKAVQKRLKTVLAEIPLPAAVYGVKGRGHIAHVRRHIGKRYHLKTDLHHFFPSVTRNRVVSSLLSAGYALGVAELVAGLCTLHGTVPQGAPTSSHVANVAFSLDAPETSTTRPAPTSSHVANVAFREIDAALESFCGPRGIVYSRFVDDLLFSGAFDFKALQPELFGLIEGGRFRRNHQKTAYKVGPLRATGITVRNNVLALDGLFFVRLGDPDVAQRSRDGLRNYVRDVLGAVGERGAPRRRGLGPRSGSAGAP